MFRHPLSWRSRIFRATIAGILLLLAIRLAWGWHARRAATARLDDLRARGEPVSVDDVSYPPIPDAQNAWDYQLRAMQALVSGVDSPANSNLEYPNYPPYPTAWWQLAEMSEKAHGQLFALARQARPHTRVRIRDRLTSPVSQILLPYLNGARATANALGDGALYVHLKGNDAESLERLRDLFHLARSIRQDDFLISQLVGIGIESLALHRTQVIAPGLNVTAATRDQVAALIRELLDEEIHWRGLAHSLRMEQLAAIDTTRVMAADVWLIAPLADRQIVRDLANTRTTIQAADARTRPQVDATLAGVRPETAGYVVNGLFGTGASQELPRHSRLFFAGFGGHVSRYFETTYRVLAERRATAVSLAAQLYRADRRTWPARLEDLVPAYLPAVPTDPFHADGRAIGYVVRELPDGTPRPLLHFGPGSVDDVPFGREPLFGWQVSGRPPLLGGHQFRDVSRFAPPPSPKAVDDDPDEPDAPGDEPEAQDDAQQP